MAHVIHEPNSIKYHEIHYLEIQFEGMKDKNVTANFTIIDSNPIQGHEIVLLGMPFMRFYRINLDFEKSKMKIENHTIDIIIKDH